MWTLSYNTENVLMHFALLLFCRYFQVTQATNQIVMNCADIDIITASFSPEGGEGERFVSG